MPTVVPDTPQPCPEASVGVLPHHYGPRVRLLSCPVLRSQLAAICQTTSVPPHITATIRELFVGLCRAALSEIWPCHEVFVPTRMAELCSDDRGIWRGRVLYPKQRAVTVALARAGTVASQAVFDMLCGLVDPTCVRQDHIYINRMTDAAGAVVGVNMTGNKIGGDVADAIVFIPDPMGASGSTMCRTLATYRARPDGAPRRFVAMHLIVTPEYLRAVCRHDPDVVIYALRLDRGMSPAHLLSTPLGAHWQDERGLNAQHYIVPGAGGLGEVLNNSFV